DGITEPYVDIKRNRELRFAGRGNFIDVLRLVVHLEGLVSVAAEDLRPGSRLLLNDRQQVCRNRPREELVRSCGVVANTADVAGFVLHLDGDNRVLIAIDLLQ